MSDRVDLCVVGSGFGGAVTALRGAQRGWSVRVLERGRSFAPGQFPRDIRQVRDVFWRADSVASRQGLYELRLMQGAGIVCASGVGGGSLIYANVLIRPEAWAFDDARWPAPYSRQMLEPYFERVEAMLSPRPMPTELQIPKRKLFELAANRLGRPVFDPPQAVCWDTPPSANRQACRLCAECEFGCNVGAKNTLDLTYLRDAEKRGATIAAQQRVDCISRDADGYRVHGQSLVDGQPFSLGARRVVLAAGTLGTNRILLRSRDVERGLPGLSPRLGMGFSANGDLLGAVHHAATDLAPWRGTDVTSVIRFTDRTPRFTMAAPSFNQPVMEFLSRTGQPELPDAVADLAQPLWSRLESAVDLGARLGLFDRRGWLLRSDAGRAARTTNLFCIGQDNANGRLALRDGRITCEWAYASENAALIAAQQSAMREVASIYGGTYSPVFAYGMFRKTLSVHPLGGASLGISPEEGVVNPDGEVFGYPALYVADGAAIPTAIGFHPCLTIAAVAERVAERMQ